MKELPSVLQPSLVELAHKLKVDHCSSTIILELAEVAPALLAKLAVQCLNPREWHTHGSGVSVAINVEVSAGSI